MYDDDGDDRDPYGVGHHHYHYHYHYHYEEIQDHHCHCHYEEIQDHHRLLMGGMIVDLGVYMDYSDYYQVLLSLLGSCSS